MIKNIIILFVAVNFISCSQVLFGGMVAGNYKYHNQGITECVFTMGFFGDGRTCTCRDICKGKCTSSITLIKAPDFWCYKDF